MKRITGLTLVELLIAIAISALIGIATFTLVQVTLNTDRSIAVVTKETNTLARAFNRMADDFMQLAPTRNVRSAFGDYEGYIHRDFDTLKLVRNGWSISAFSPYERSTLQRVSYQLAQRGSELCPYQDDLDTDTQCLVRSYTNHLDDDGTFEWHHQMLAEHITSIEWRFLVEDAMTGRTDFVTQLPRFDQETRELESPITAIEVLVSVANGHEYSRLFNVPTTPKQNKGENRDAP